MPLKHKNDPLLQLCCIWFSAPKKESSRLHVALVYHFLEGFSVNIGPKNALQSEVEKPRPLYPIKPISTVKAY